MLAEDARELRETDASTAARALDEATSEAVPGKSLWEKIKDIFKKVLGFISAALGIIAMLIPGLQGLGLVLTIASLVTAAVPFIMNIVDSIQSGEWDVLDMVLSGLGLVLGGVGLIKIANLGGIANTLKTVTSDLKAIQINLKSVVPAIKSFTGFKNPGDLVANLLKNIPGGVLKTPDVLKQLPGLTNIWTKTAGWIDQSSNLIGLAGLAWAINGAVPNGTTNTIKHDPSYVEGST